MRKLIRPTTLENKLAKIPKNKERQPAAIEKRPLKLNRQHRHQ